MIVIPMAGESRRFYDAGYKLPKYMLKIHGRTLFNLAVSSFKKYFNKEHFLFICKNGPVVKEFIENETKNIHLNKWELVQLDCPTKGQAETVAFGLQNNSNCPINDSVTIFNIDTFRPSFQIPENPDIKNADGYLEVFQGSGSNWSYVRPESDVSTKVIETAEKLQISNLCCTGLYHFASVDLYLKAYQLPKKPKSDAEKVESYVAPIYNNLISEGADIRYKKISSQNVIFCGTPSEYELLANNPLPQKLNVGNSKHGI